MNQCSWQIPINVLKNDINGISIQFMLNANEAKLATSCLGSTLRR
jgi:hypothetical protein